MRVLQLIDMEGASTDNKGRKNKQNKSTTSNKFANIMLTYDQGRAKIRPFLSTSGSPSSPASCRSRHFACRIYTYPDGLSPLVECLHGLTPIARNVSQQSERVVSHKDQGTKIKFWTYEA